MIKVLKHNEMIANVPRCFGSPIHLYWGWLGVVVLFAGFPIYFAEQSSKVKSVGFYTATIESEQPFICEATVYITCQYVKGVMIPEMIGCILFISRRASSQAGVRAPIS